MKFKLKNSNFLGNIEELCNKIWYIKAKAMTDRAMAVDKETTFLIMKAILLITKYDNADKDESDDNFEFIFRSSTYWMTSTRPLTQSLIFLMFTKYVGQLINRAHKQNTKTSFRDVFDSINATYFSGMHSIRNLFRPININISNTVLLRR